MCFARIIWLLDTQDPQKDPQIFIFDKKKHKKHLGTVYFQDSKNDVLKPMEVQCTCVA